MEPTSKGSNKTLLAFLFIIGLTVLVSGILFYTSKDKEEDTINDASVAAVTGASLKLELKGRTDRPADPTVQSTFNVKEKAEFNVVATLPAATAGGTTSNYRAMVLKIQLDKRYFDETTVLMNIDQAKYFAQPSNGFVNCTAIDVNYACKEISISVLNDGKFATTENFGLFSVIAKAPSSAAKISVDRIAAAVVFSDAKYSYLQGLSDASVADNFIPSADAQKSLIIEDQCLGDYNRIKGPENAIVDINDFSEFAKNYNKALTGSTLMFDLVKVTGEPNQILNVQDLAKFADNYKKATCVHLKSSTF
jgi:hypothetical protein